ncbi:MAG: HEPN domain-containing protein [Bacteroidetes bacterium]|nr:HEPN domain-containing protein [Bacteroidota bacterium]
MATKENNTSSNNSYKLIGYWISTSDYDYETMIDLYRSKRYHWALFMGHLSIEKLLKAYYVKVKRENPPFIHNLLRLAEKADLELDNEQKNILATLTTFNINTRYDDYKLSFYKTCTREFTKKWIEHIKDYRQWIKELLK